MSEIIELQKNGAVVPAEKKNELRQVTDALLMDTSTDLAKRQTMSVPISSLASLGAAVSSIAPALRTVTETTTVNTIDAIGDKAATERKVFDACHDAVQELTNLLRIVVNDLQGTDILITADHGFLYTYEPLSESDKVDRTAFQGEVYETGRRYALTAPSTTADYLLPVRLAGSLSGVAIQGVAPCDVTRIKMSGGGENYVHGGISLQELVVPILAFKNLRTDSKGYAETSNAELKLLSQSRKIANLIFSIDLFQRQPVSEKVRSCAYSVYMADEAGSPVSDRQTVVADRSALNDSERVFHVRLSLRAGAYDKNKTYRLVITNGVDLPTEEDFQIDIAFADDFGFDL